MKKLIIAIVLMAGSAWATDFRDSLQVYTDDGRIYGASSYTSGNTYTCLGNDGETNSSWYLFRGVTIPASATISAAHISFKADGNGSVTTCKVIIYGNDTASAIYPGSFAAYGLKVTTTASVSWTITAWTSGTFYDSPDLSTVVQEIVNRVDWTSGNAMMFLVKDDGSTANAIRNPSGWDGADATRGPYLEVTYTTGAVTTTTIIRAAIVRGGVVR